MKLIDFYGERVNITTDNGRHFSGFVGDYVYPEDNELGNESIIVDTVNGEVVEFKETDIKEISIQ